MTFDNRCTNPTICAKSIKHPACVNTELWLERTPAPPVTKVVLQLPSCPPAIVVTATHCPSMYRSCRPSIALNAACSLIRPPRNGLLLGQRLGIRDIEQWPVNREPDRARVATYRCQNHLVIPAKLLAGKLQHLAVALDCSEHHIAVVHQRCEAKSVGVLLDCGQDDC